MVCYRFYLFIYLFIIIFYLLLRSFGECIFFSFTRACVVTVILRYLVSLKDRRRREREASIKKYAKVQEDAGDFIVYVIKQDFTVDRPVSPRSVLIQENTR